MSELEEIRQKLREHKPNLQEKYNVKEIGIFGSYVHDDFDASSDIDILVEFSEPIGWEFVDLKDDLEDLLNRPVDLVTKAALKPKMKTDIMKEVVYA